ncbi:hypothetical protein MycrhN_3555 [Mycolicibacterium rhodesiae NBB3]|uniref:DUF6542 domain-containing protein n=1 Tax=Mycolicibacterium rhodesiae (strain NBB3) TaxID=710685 RepID=G8RT87_MYCRN|nr:hypothetical protein MycrhN_3555 [Mycolicibacterium rhodesiae NBB3]
MLIAATLMAVGFAYDAGSGAKELTGVFAGTYVVGCILAVLAVRQAGIFTAVIQPPLLLFGAVPTAYFVFTGSELTNLKDALINCAYPLIERFPLMFFTSAIVLLIGMARWYLGMSSRRGAAPSAAAKDQPSGDGLVASVIAKVSALVASHRSDDEEADEPPRRRSSTERASRSSSRDGRPRGRSTPSRSRHARPPDTEYIEPVADRPRRPRPSRQTDPNEPRRKPRSGSSQRRATPPADRRTGYERPERRRRYDDEPPLHSNNGNGTHHPISRVRYRGGEDGEDYAQYRAPRRTARDRAAENWEYDI